MSTVDWYCYGEESFYVVLDPLFRLYYDKIFHLYGYEWSYRDSRAINCWIRNIEIKNWEEMFKSEMNQMNGSVVEESDMNWYKFRRILSQPNGGT